MRLQLALNVSDLEKAVEFYSRLFGVEPARRRPGYANFAIDQPPLKLVLFEAGHGTTDDEGCFDGGGGTINHLGVEVETTDEVLDAERRLSVSGLETTGVDDTQCCFAEKTETWITDPDGTAWEWYVRTGDSEVLENVVLGSRS
ncbi:ArsI/CadI family heavy metal resistance metalloenzyme [Candidatus Poriferisocius sp.]|uniref:ArsI/CadI family heavy metal resistance metalloenzyme n=1 Tax=Candidatus Poriferisocius sp. TaxID=3101276 RepID=UPI003B52B565